MADNNKAVGPLAAAKLVALIKAETAKKYDKTGGKIEGSAEIAGDLQVAGYAECGALEAQTYVKGDAMVMSPVIMLDDAATDVYLSTAGDGAAKLTTTGADADAPLARLKVATPTGDNDAATKAYVDEGLAQKAGKDVATADVDGLMSSDDKKKLDSMYDIVATSTDGETFDITPAQLHEKLKGVPTPCAIKVVDTIIPLYRVQLPGDGSTTYVFQITKDNGWNPTTRLSYTASAGGTSLGTKWVKSENDFLAITPGLLKFTGAAEAQFRGREDVTIDIPTGEGAVRYDETQKLTSDQKSHVCQNIGAVEQKGAWMEGTVMLLPSGADGSRIINITPSDKSNDYTLTLDAGPENVPVRVSGIETPTDAQTDCAANVAYVKAKVAEVAASGGVDVDNALSATSTNPVQNKVVKAALDKKAGTAVATTSANGLMSKADKTKLDGIAAGANKITIDSTMSGSSVNPVQNKVIKQYVDDKVAAAGSNITVDAALSSTSTNPVQNKAVKAAIDAKADKTALDGKLDKSGGTLTGNLTGKYITGTWLQTTAASDLGRTPGKIAVLDDSGWVYYRTPAELLADLGADYIESQGTTGVWTWRKWHSGIAEMWGIFEATSLAVNNAWGSVYYGTWMSSTANKNGRKYPFAFADAPVVTATPYSPSTDFWLLTDSANNVGTALTHAPAYACVLPGSTTITHPQIHYHVIGKYK